MTALEPLQLVCFLQPKDGLHLSGRLVVEKLTGSNLETVKGLLKPERSCGERSRSQQKASAVLVTPCQRHYFL